MIEFDLILNLIQSHRSLGSCISLPAASQVGSLVSRNQLLFHLIRFLQVLEISAEWPVLIEGMISTLVTKSCIYQILASSLVGKV